MSDLDKIIEYFAGEFGLDADELSEACAVYNTTVIQLLFGFAGREAQRAQTDKAVEEYVTAAEAMLDTFRKTDGIDFDQRHEQIAKRLLAYEAAKRGLAKALDEAA
jgi:hypothetical protein